MNATSIILLRGYSMIEFILYCFLALPPIYFVIEFIVKKTKPSASTECNSNISNEDMRVFQDFDKSKSADSIPQSTEIQPLESNALKSISEVVVIQPQEASAFNSISETIVTQQQELNQFSPIPRAIKHPLQESKKSTITSSSHKKMLSEEEELKWAIAQEKKEAFARTSDLHPYEHNGFCNFLINDYCYKYDFGPANCGPGYSNIYRCTLKERRSLNYKVKNNDEIYTTDISQEKRLTMFGEYYYDKDRFNKENYEDILDYYENLKNNSNDE